MIVEGGALVDVTDLLRDHDRTVGVYEVTGHHDVVAVGKFRDTDHVNERTEELLADPNIQESNTSVVLDPACEHE